MMKYLFCILLGILLISILHSAPDKERQEVGTGFGVTGTSSSYSQSNHQFPESADQQPYATNESAYEKSYNKEYNYTINNGIFETSFSYRGFSSSNTLRFNISIIIILILSSLIAQQSKEKNGKTSLYTNPAKLSYRYYIYTLKHILI